MSSRKKKEEEEKRKQEQGYRRRQTNQSGTGQKSAIAGIKQAVAEKEAQINAQQAANRKSTDTHANSGGGTVEKIANTVAKKAAETAAKASESRTGQSVAQEIKAEAERAAKKAAEKAVSKAEASRQEKNKNRKSTDTRANSGKNAVQDVKNSVQKLAERLGSTEKGKKAIAAEKGMQRILDQYRVLDDLEARTAQRRSNILNNREVPGAGTGAAKELLGTEIFRPRWSPYAPDSMSFPTPSGLDRMAKDLDLRSKAYGLGKEKVSMADILAATALDPLSALKADSKSYANFGRGYGMKSKPWDAGLTGKELVQAATDRVKARNREMARQQSAAEQTLSPADRKLREQFQDEIRLAKADYDAAKARGDTAGMQAAHKRAETWRRIEGGYSGGAAGNEHITPKLDQSDISALNKAGQTQLRAAKLGYDNAQTDAERARYAAMGQDIRRNPAYLKETYDRGAYRETDANGRMRYAGTAEERAKEAEQAAAIPKAIGTGIAGSFLSLPGTTARALQTDAARNQAALQRLSDIRGGGEVNIPEPERLRTGQEILAELRNSERYQNASAISKAKKLGRAMRDVKNEVPLGQRLLNRSDIYRAKATEGQTGLNRYLTEALITGGEMIPGLTATALTGGMAAPGLAVMGAQAAGRRMGDLERQGEDPVRAFNRGLVTGLIEAGTELIPLRNLAKIARGGGGKSFARNLLTQALEEAGTEEVSEVGGYLADRAFGDPNASLTAQDLKDTAVISLLTSLGMGAGAGIVGGRRTGGIGRQPEGRTTDQAGTRNGPVRQESAAQTEDSIQAREAQLQAREKALDARAQEALEQMARSTDSDTYYNHFRNKLAQVRQEQAQVRQERVRLAETRRQAEISREVAQTRRAEAERIAAESRYRPEAAREAGAALAEDQVRRVDRTAQAARDRLNGEVRPTITALRDTLRGAAEQTELLDSLQLPLAEDPERRAAQEKRLAGKPLSMKEQLMERDTGSMVKTIAGRETRTDHAYRVVPLSQWEQEYMPSGKISRNAAEFDPNGDEHASNGGVDWYLGGYSKRYGGKNGTVVILEAPAVTSKFQPAQDNGTRMTLDPTIRHIKSSSKANPVELSELTGAWKWDKRTGEITEIDLSPWKRAARNNSLTPLEVPQRARETAQEPEGSRATSARYGQAENHIDNRQSQDLGDRRVKAFQWDHPEVKPFFRKAAAELKQQVEYADSTKTAQRASSIQRARGKKAGTVMAKNGPIRRLMDQGLSTTEIIKACDAIIHDQGQENYAAAKRVELVLDNMLSHGYLPVEMAGVWDENAIVAPNTDYLRVKEALPGAVTRGSFADYLRRNELALELGEVTEEQLRQEWEAERRVREDRESLYRSAESWGQNPRRYRTMEEELAAHAERVSDWMDEPEMQDMPEEYWERYWQQAKEEERLIREKWAGREAQTPRVREYVDPETGELVLETRIPVEEAGTAPAVTEAPVRTETVREEGQKNTPREAEESTAVNTNPARHTAEEQAAIEAHQNSTEAERNGKSDEEAENVSDQDPYSVGAAPGGFDPVSEWQESTDRFHPVNPKAEEAEAENWGRAPVDIPVRDPYGQMTSKAASTLVNAGMTPNQISDAFTEMARSGKLSYIPYTDDAATQEAERVIRDNGFQRAKEEWTAEVRAGKMSKDLTTRGIVLYNNAANAGSVVEAIDIATDLIEYAHTAGQILQAVNIINKLGPAGQLYAFASSMDKLEQKIREKQKKDGAHWDGIEIDKDLAKQYMEAQNEEERQAVEKEIKKDIARQIPNTLQDKLDAWRYMAMLGNPRTQIRNLAGNLGFQPVRIAKNAVGAALERAVGLDQSQRTKSLQFKALSKADRARYQAGLDEYAQVESTIMGNGKYNDTFSDIDQYRRIFKLKFLEGWRQLTNAGLEKGDVFFAKRTYADSLAGILKARGITAEEYTDPSFDQNRKAEIQAIAVTEAQKATYRDLNQFSKWVSRLGQGPNTPKAVHYLTEGLLPFKKTPANILVRGLEYSPVGLLRGIKDMGTKVKSGEMTAAEGIDELASGLTGTALLGLGVALAASGLITPGDDDDSKQKAFDQLLGKQSYALRLPGGYSFTLDWLSPEAIPFFMGVEAQNSWGNIQSGKKGKDVVWNAVRRISDPMLEMSMLQGVNDLIENVSYADNKFMSILATMATGYLSQFIPTIGGQLERTLEDRRYSTWIDRDSWVPNEVQYLIAKNANKIPGLEYHQREYLNAWGEPEMTGSPLVRALTNFASPGYLKKGGGGEIEAELQRLYDAGFDVFPTIEKTSAKINDKYVTAEQFNLLQGTKGQMMKDFYAKTISSPEYQELSDADKAKVLSREAEYAKSMGQVAAGRPLETLDAWAKNTGSLSESTGIGVAALIEASGMAQAINARKGETPLNKTLAFYDYMDKKKYSTEQQDALTEAYFESNAKTRGYADAIRSGAVSQETMEQFMEAAKEFDVNKNGLDQDETVKTLQSMGLPHDTAKAIFEATGQKNEDGTVKTTYEDKLKAVEKAEEKAAKFAKVPADVLPLFEEASKVQNQGSGYWSYDDLYYTAMAVDTTDENREAWFNAQKPENYKKSWQQVKNMPHKKR